MFKLFIENHLHSDVSDNEIIFYNAGVIPVNF